MDSGASQKQNEPAEAMSNVNKARELFKNKTVRGIDVKADDGLKTAHERAVTCIADASPIKGGKTTVLSTSGLDGRLVVWNLPSLSADFANLAI